MVQMMIKAVSLSLLLFIVLSRKELKNVPLHSWKQNSSNYIFFVYVDKASPIRFNPPAFGLHM